MKRILCLDGGGCKGLIPISVLTNISDILKKPIYEIFDLIIASSVGAVEGGLLSTGVISASTLRDVIYTQIPAVFKKRLRIPILQPIYSRKPLADLLNAYIPNMKMNQCKTKFIATSVSMTDGRTHFFKSWEKDDGELYLSDAILRSGAAPLFFGSIPDKLKQAVWIDGGCGNMNAPMMEGFIEVMRQKWLAKEHVHILSLGCGQANPGVPYKKAKGYKNIRQVYYYANIPEGGLAHIQMANTQAMWLTDFSQYNFDFSFQRIEKYDMPKKLDTLDGVKYRNDYVRIGEELAKTVDYTHLK